MERESVMMKRAYEITEVKGIVQSLEYINQERLKTMSENN